jgi:hypothetical protein
MRWRAAIIASAFSWTQLIQQHWTQPGEPVTPDSEWQTFGEFDSRAICESYRTGLIAEQTGSRQTALVAHSVCKVQ